MSKASSLPASAPEITISPFCADDIPAALALSQDVSWPHRAQDWALSLSVSHGSVARIGTRIVGTALCSVFGPVVTLNMIIVASDLRGHGLGRRLMQAVMDQAQDKEQRLIATADGLPLYEKLGFKAVGHIHQHQGIAVKSVPALPVHTGTSDDLVAFAAADQDATGMQRAQMLERFLDIGEMLVTDGGFAMVRPFGRGYVLGPIVARGPATAQALMSEAASRCHGQFLRVDLADNSELVPLSESLGLARAGGGVVMERQSSPHQSNTFTTFALASQAMG